MSNVPYRSTFSTLRVVDSYVHLGTATSFKPFNNSEISIRSAIVRRDLAKLSTKLYKHPSFSLSHRLTMVKAYLFSKGCYNAATWPPFQVSSFKVFNSSILTVYRRITNTSFFSGSAMIQDSEVLFNFGLQAPSVLVAAARLMLFGRVFHKKQTYVFLQKTSTNTGFSEIREFRRLKCFNTSFVFGCFRTTRRFCKLFF